ncbi:MAG: hypothetical protein HGA65_14900 [Oscillochloris sp.]|nr:hypothetical protein [Oscillochloris sp.]
MTQPEGNNSNDQQQPDLANELRELGQQIEQTVRTALESERARQIQKDIMLGMREIGVQVQSALKALQEDERVRDLAERGQQAINQAQQSPAARDFQETLTRGISQLNDQLSAFVTRLQNNTNPPPTTGETTRLDEDK